MLTRHFGHGERGRKGHWVTGLVGCLSRPCCSPREPTARRFQVKAVVTSSDIFLLGLDRHCLALAALSPDLLCCYMMTFSLFTVSLNLLGVCVIDGSVCHSMSGNLLVIYYNVWMCGVFFPAFPLSPPMSDGIPAGELIWWDRLFFLSCKWRVWVHQSQLGSAHFKHFNFLLTISRALV